MTPAEKKFLVGDVIAERIWADPFNVNTQFLVWHIDHERGFYRIAHMGNESIPEPISGLTFYDAQAYELLDSVAMDRTRGLGRIDQEGKLIECKTCHALEREVSDDSR